MNELLVLLVLVVLLLMCCNCFSRDSVIPSVRWSYVIVREFIACTQTHIRTQTSS